jgi:hypothetical protein
MGTSNTPTNPSKPGAGGTQPGGTQPKEQPQTGRQPGTNPGTPGTSQQQPDRSGTQPRTDKSGPGPGRVSPETPDLDKNDPRRLDVEAGKRGNSPSPDDSRRS